MKVFKIFLMLGALLSFDVVFGQSYNSYDDREGQEFYEQSDRRPHPRRGSSSFKGQSEREGSESGYGERRGRGGSGKHCNKGGGRAGRGGGHHGGGGRR